MELSLRRLRILHEFARCGTITEAAAALHYTPSAVSQQLSVLQTEIGRVLLEPVGRRLQLTDLGRVLAEHAAEILDAERRARIALEQQQEVLTGTLRVGVLATIAASLVPPALTILARRHPRVVVRTREVSPEHALKSVRDGDLDLAFVLDYPDVPMSWDLGLESTVVGVEEHQLVVPSGRLPGDESVELAELAGLDWVVSGGDTDYGRALLTVCRFAGFEPRIAHQVDEQATAMAMVAGRLGVTLVAELGLALRPQGVDVRRLRRPIERRVVLVRRQATRHRPSESAFLRCVLEAGRSLGLRPSDADGAEDEGRETRGRGGGADRIEQRPAAADGSV
jgi:DNA-binding transcriptional LysR family regulator